MRAWLIGLGLPLVVACAGNSVGSPTQASVEASLPAWCQSTCEQLAACEGQDNSIDDVADCAQHCRAELRNGAQRSLACAQRIDQFQSCVDAHGCSVNSGDVCSLDDAKECEDDNDVDVESPGAAPSPDGAGGSSAGPGPAPPPIDGTSGAPIGAPTLGPVVHCGSGSGTGGAPPSPATGQLLCETSYSDCSNGSSYSVTCVSTSAGQSTCWCFVDDQAPSAFDPGGVCPSPARLNFGCGWNIQ